MGNKGEFLPSSAEWPLAGVLISGAREEIHPKPHQKLDTFFGNSVPRLGQRVLTLAGHRLISQPTCPPSTPGCRLTRPGSQAVQTLVLCPLHSEMSGHSEVFSDI